MMRFRGCYFVLYAAATAFPGSVLGQVPQSGDFIVADQPNARLILVESKSGFYQTFIKLGEPGKINIWKPTLARDGKSVFVPRWCNPVSKNGDIVGIDLATREIRRVAGGFSAPITVSVTDKGDLLVADMEDFGGSGSIYRVNPVTGATKTVASGGELVDPVQAVEDGDGNVIVANAFLKTDDVLKPSDRESGNIVSINSRTGGQSVLYSEPRGAITGVAVERGTGDIVFQVTFFPRLGGEIRRLNPKTQEVTVIASGDHWTLGTGIQLDERGDVVLTTGYNRESNEVVCLNVRKKRALRTLGLDPAMTREAVKKRRETQFLDTIGSYKSFEGAAMIP